MRQRADQGAAGIDRVLAQAVASGAVPGVVAMAARAEDLLYEGAFGVRNMATGAPMTLDSVFPLASATKALTAAAAMQLVESGRIGLDEPAARVLPELAQPQVVEGFADDGRPRLRPARRAITLRQLLTHTSGFGYPSWSAVARRYSEAIGLPLPGSNKLEFLKAPLLFEPGTGWAYGIGMDWVGQMVERLSGLDLNTYLTRHLFEPLGMSDSGFLPTVEQQSRIVALHERRPDGGLAINDSSDQLPAREFFTGGGGSLSSAMDYLRFLRMLLNGGSLDGHRVLQAETVALMRTNQIGEIEVGRQFSTNRARSTDIEFFEGIPKKWGLSFMINARPVPGRRSAGSLAWAGLANTHYWWDPTANVCGLMFTQLWPFCDPGALVTLESFERALYANPGASRLGCDSADRTGRP